MATVCPQCEKKFENDAMYCTECGTKTTPQSTVTPPQQEAASPTVNTTAQTPVNTAANTTANTTDQAPTNTATPPATNTAASVGQVVPFHLPQPTEKAVSTGTYFGLMFLFGIPLIGFLACILMCFIPKNPNIKNFAKAHLIWAIIALVVGLLVVLAVSAIVTTAINTVSAMLPSPLEDLLGDLDLVGTVEQFLEPGGVDALFGEVDWSKVDMSQLDKLRPLMNRFGVDDLSQLKPILEQLGVNDFSDLQPLLEQLDTSDLSQVEAALNQFGVDDLTELEDLLVRYDIDSIDELTAFAEQWGSGSYY